MRRIIFAAALIVAFGLGFLLKGGGAPPAEKHENGPRVEAAATTWTCSMHPQIKLPKAGKCPICFMDLIPLVNDAGDDPGPTTLVLSERAAALAEIQTTQVTRREVTTSLRLTGKVDYDETRNRTIAAWVPGRIDTLFVDFTGTEVVVGDPLVSVYSPDLYAAQAELLNAVRAESSLSKSSDKLILRTAQSTVEAAKERLRLWGLQEGQISAIIDRGKARHHLRISAPVGGVVVHKNAVEGKYIQTGSSIYTLADLSKVWVILDAFEADLAWLKTGQDIEFTVQAVPGRTFTGSIVFIDPVLNSRTRTVSVRLEVDNSSRLLKPGMFVSAIAQAGIVDSGQPADNSSNASIPLVIPATAPLITGERAVVYLRLPDREKPTFEGSEITLGPRAGDHYIVEEGLREGDLVVTKGNFKLDSALQIQAKPSMMNPEGGGPVPGHNHGEAESGKNQSSQYKKEDGAESKIFTVSGTFTEQLGGMLDAYLELQGALAADDDSGALVASRGLKNAISAVDMALVEGDAHIAWMADMTRLNVIVEAITTSKGIASKRARLLELTPAVWDTLRRYGYQRSETVRLFRCPMANENKGGDWIQLETQTSNPYFGASMLRCGSQIDSMQTAIKHGGH